MTPCKTPSYEHVPPPDLPSVRSQGAHPSQEPGTYLQRDRGQKTNNPERARATSNHRQNLQTQDPTDQRLTLTPDNGPTRHLRGRGPARLDFPKKVPATCTQDKRTHSAWAK